MFEKGYYVFQRYNLSFTKIAACISRRSAMREERKGSDLALIIHADDYGITLEQSRAILDLSDACGGHGALSSISIFANSPAFAECADLARPFVERGAISIGVHVNVVEGHPLSDPRDIPLLVNEHGTFNHAFTGLLLASSLHTVDRDGIREQLAREIAAQLERYLEAFPEQRRRLRIDTHQHTHMVPLVHDALIAASRRADCVATRARIPVEPIGPYLAHPARAVKVAPINLVKDALLKFLAPHCRKDLEDECVVPAFSGIVMSGRMDKMTPEILADLEARAAKEGRDLEVLFHPVSVPIEQCLDPENLPFARACASPGRDREAQLIRDLAK